LRVVTLNVNGIRAAARKGLYRWIAAQKADIVCLQEVKAHEADLDAALLAPRGFSGFFHCAEKKGYAGVALYSRRQPQAVVRGFGVREFDAEGRFLEARFAKLSVVSVYLPSGSSGPHRQASKFRFLDAFLPQLEKLRRSRREVILCGDWNIAHRQIDLKNWRANQKNSGFLPEERDWLT
jgi:exodeoxyribonuclease-3